MLNVFRPYFRKTCNVLLLILHFLQFFLKLENNTIDALLIPSESGQNSGQTSASSGHSFTFILQSDIVEAHQGKQSVTADLKPLPQQSHRQEVFGRSVWSVQGGCQSDKELCGEAPKSLVYH